MNVLIVPEDFRKDQYVLKPIIAEILRAAGSVRPEIRVCLEPLLGGISHCLDWVKISAILDRYSGMVDLFLIRQLCPEDVAAMENRIRDWIKGMG